MGVNRTVAINENELNRLILDINDFTIKVKKIFDEMESTILQLRFRN